MKKKEVREVVYCDNCKKENYVTACMHCGIEHCWECREIAGKEYPHSVYSSGSGDGYYCSKCDKELTIIGDDAIHKAYRTIAYLRKELDSWLLNFKVRQEKAEAKLKSLQEI